MTALIRKELRQLLPIFALFAALTVIEFLANTLSSSFGFATWASDCSIGCEPGNRSYSVISVMFVSFITAYSLYPNEHDSGTINFLRAMPVSRLTIFKAKLVAGIIVVTGVAVIGYARWMLVVGANSSSLTGGLYPALTATFFFRDVIALTIYLAYGMWLSTMRTFGFVLIFASVVVLILLDRARLHSFMDPLELFRVEYAGETLVLPWAAIGFQCVLALIALWLAYRHWSHADSWGLSRQSSQKTGKLKTLGWLAAAFGLALLAGTQFAQKNPAETRYTGPVASLQTHYFRFVFPERAQAPARMLIRQADTLYEDVSASINAETEPVIRVDLTQTSEHFAGLARWKSFRMDISRPDTRIGHAFVLAHETVHVFQGTESDRGMRRHAHAVQFFTEGSAEYIAHQVIGGDSRRELDAVLASISVAGENFTFAELANGARVASKYDVTLLYGLGNLWTEALVDSCGADAIGDTIRSFRELELPFGISGENLWTRVLASIDCSLVDVNNRWQALMAAAAARSMYSFPAHGAATVEPRDNGSHLLRVEFDGDSQNYDDGRFSVRIVNDSAVSNEPDDHFNGQYSKSDKSLTFRIPAYAFTSKRFRYQVMWRHRNASVPFMYKTQSGSLP